MTSLHIWEAVVILVGVAAISDGGTSIQRREVEERGVVQERTLVLPDGTREIATLFSFCLPSHVPPRMLNDGVVLVHCPGAQLFYSDKKDDGASVSSPMISSVMHDSPACGEEGSATGMELHALLFANNSIPLKQYWADCRMEIRGRREVLHSALRLLSCQSHPWFHATCVSTSFAGRYWCMHSLR